MAQLILENLDLDGDTVGLRSTDKPFINLNNALALMQQRPEMPASINQDFIVVGLRSTHPLFALTASEMLEHLDALDLRGFITHGWKRYWDDRAPHTPVSRRTRANQLYKGHFEAAAQVAFALGQLSTEQLKPALAKLGLPEDSDRAVYAERLRFKWADGHCVPLHAALVLTIDTVPLTAQLLYTPFRQPVLQIFRERNALESWMLAEQGQLIASDRPRPASEIDYELIENPFTDAMEAWLADAEARLLAALTQNSGTDFATQGANAMHAIDLTYRQLRDDGLFPAPSDSPVTAGADEESGIPPTPFGLLSADLPLATRLATLKQQRLALETLLDPGQADPLHRLKPHIDDLSAAQNSADSALTSLLENKTGLQLQTLHKTASRAKSELYTARVKGLRAEAEIQRLLKQISNDEYLRLQAVLNHPDRQDRTLPVAACRLLVSKRSTNGEYGETVVQHQELRGLLAIVDAADLQDPSSDHGVLLWWPGRSGGLQRFASRETLHTALFNIQPDDAELSLQLTEVLREALDYGLQSQTHQCSQKAALLIQTDADPAVLRERAAELQALPEKCRLEWQVHRHDARDLAYAQLVEQQRSVTLAEQRPQWVNELSDAQAAELRPMIKASVDALRRSQVLVQRDLPSASRFSQGQVDQRLREDFSLLKPFTLTLDLPVTVEKQPLLGSGAPGSFSPRTVNRASTVRSTLKLHELALFTVDDTLKDRLEFMKVEVINDDEAERQRLLTGITAPYVKRIIAQLDVAQKYEDLITRTFLGTPVAPSFSDAYQQETLLENWRLLLKLQRSIAKVRGHLKDDALQILDIAIDASTDQAWRQGNRRIVIKPAFLTVGGSDTEGLSSTLLGVTFIEELNSGVTLLYLPDRVDGRFFYRFDTLEAARKALFNWCFREEMHQYLAGRALGGKTELHAHRIKQALLKHYDAIIGVGVAWPASTSLSKNLLNVHMGQLLEAHRTTSRSNSAQRLRESAGKGAQAMYFIKLAMGFVPFVGTAIGLYDAWVQANMAVAAFLRGDVQEGIDALASSLHALIDAGVDLGTGLGVSSSAARPKVRLHQLDRLGRSAANFSPPSLRKSSAIAKRFAGYEYEQPISLHGLQPHSEGIYRNIYRHAQGDFMLSQGRICEVELDQSLHTLRLKGTRTKTYKQPIVLDETGDWNTHGAVYGTLVNGGLAGGGGVLGHLADRLDPVWPLTIRERLPLWWTDRAWRQQLRLQGEAMALGRRVSHQLNRTKRLEVLYLNAQSQGKSAALTDLRQSLRESIELALEHDRALAQLPRPAGRQAITVHQGMRRANAASIVRNNIELANYARKEMLAPIEQFTTLTLERVRAGDLINHAMRRKAISLRIREALDEVEQCAQTANTWHQKIMHDRDFKFTETDAGTLSAYKTLDADLAELNANFGTDYRRHVTLSFSLESFNRYDGINEVSWFYLFRQTLDSHVNISRALNLHFLLDRSPATRTQRLAMLEACIQDYQHFSRDLKTWNLGYPQHFDQPRLSTLLDDVEKMIELAQKDIGIRPGRARDPALKVFTTEENRLLVGTEAINPTTSTRQYIVEAPTGQVETWHLDPHSNRARLAAPKPSTPVPELNLAHSTLVNEAQSRLNAVDTYRSKVQSYAQQNMSPVNLEHMLVSEAAELTVRANRIGRVAPDEAIIGQLRSKAAELTVAGRQLRVQQSMSSKQPTGGFLAYLLAPHKDDRQAIRLSKLAERIANGKRQDGRTDFLQEYAVHDLTRPNEPVLWYVHAHYDSATAPFDDVVKAHLKLPEQRRLGLEWQKQQPGHAPIWRGDISRVLFLEHFKNL
ncbi:dermonecrotic toxin domain-containing protein [Pseudomonas trivialis]|uniref:dermonecrotic toxin domain-containing protein n=1 Tax=Pseudomonas trivialis TaxID=200450 RepID=UPI0030D0A286